MRWSCINTRCGSEGVVDALPKMGEDNQFIVTTHSDYLLASFGPESVVNVGAPHVVKLAELDEDDDAP